MLMKAQTKHEEKKSGVINDKVYEKVCLWRIDGER